MSPPEDEIAPGTTVGQYSIVRRIGSGGMGEVYEAMHTGLHKRVAIKTLRQEHLDNEVIVARFLREGQVASRIRHPNVVDVTDVGVIASMPCLVMEFLEGESLHALLRREKALPIDKLVDLLLPVAAAVQAAHDQGIVHRDLKPANIFLAQTWTGEAAPKVLDFGISKLLSGGVDDLTQTKSASFLGSPHYASPELARGEKLLDARSDQYALGVILFEGACGKRPFAEKAESFMALMYAISQGDFPRPRELNPNLPAPLEDAILRAMSLRREDRFPTVRELARAIFPYASPRAQTLWGPHLGVADRVDEPTRAEGMGRSSVPPSLPTPSGPVSRSSMPSLSGGPRSMPISGNMPPLSGGPPTPPPISGATPSGELRPSLNGMPASTPSGQVLSPPLITTGGPPSGHYTYAPLPQPGQQQQGGWLRFATSALVALLVGAGLSWGGSQLVVWFKYADPELVHGPAAEVEGADNSSYKVEIEVDPETAQIELDGRIVGEGTFTRRFPANGRRHKLQITAEGFEPYAKSFTELSVPPAQIKLTPSGDVDGAAPEAPEKARAPRAPKAPAPPPTAEKPKNDGPPKLDPDDPYEQ